MISQPKSSKLISRGISKNGNSHQSPLEGSGAAVNIGQSRQSGSDGCYGGRLRWYSGIVSQSKAKLMIDLLIPLSPTLPLIVPFVTSFLRSITTAEYLHQPYFEVKGMDPAAKWRWVEERKWAYRGQSHLLLRYNVADMVAFGFSASFLESIPIIGLFLSISNRVGAAMWYV